jgi:hypothetical protein
MRAYVHWEHITSVHKALPFLKAMAGKVNMTHPAGPELALLGGPALWPRSTPDLVVGDNGHTLAVAKALAPQWTPGNASAMAVAKHLKAVPAGSIGLVYKIWSVGWESVELLASELQGSNVQLVDHRALRKLILEKEEHEEHARRTA